VKINGVVKRFGGGLWYRLMECFDRENYDGFLIFNVEM